MVHNIDSEIICPTCKKIISCHISNGDQKKFKIVYFSQCKSCDVHHFGDDEIIQSAKIVCVNCRVDFDVPDDHEWLDCDIKCDQCLLPLDHACTQVKSARSFIKIF